MLRDFQNQPHLNDETVIQCTLLSTTQSYLQKTHRSTLLAMSCILRLYLQYKLSRRLSLDRRHVKAICILQSSQSLLRSYGAAHIHNSLRKRFQP